MDTFQYDLLHSLRETPSQWMASSACHGSSPPAPPSRFAENPVRPSSVLSGVTQHHQYQSQSVFLLVPATQVLVPATHQALVTAADVASAGFVGRPPPIVAGQRQQPAEILLSVQSTAVTALSFSPMQPSSAPAAPAAAARQGMLRVGASFSEPPPPFVSTAMTNSALSSRSASPSSASWFRPVGYVAAAPERQRRFTESPTLTFGERTERAAKLFEHAADDSSGMTKMASAVRDRSWSMEDSTSQDAASFMNNLHLGSTFSPPKDEASARSTSSAKGQLPRQVLGSGQSEWSWSTLPNPNRNVKGNLEVPKGSHSLPDLTEAEDSSCLGTSSSSSNSSGGNPAYCHKKQSRANTQQRSQRVIWDSKKRAIRKDWCGLCMKNGEMPKVYRGHRLHTRSEDGTIIVSCPILRRLKCDMCGASGDNAHTRSRCPAQVRQMAPLAVLLKSTPRRCDGTLRPVLI